tara:strand:- start:6603 stop:7616 length:1014 start_codon:yes stop_codon:yes gene_type:complete
MCEIQSIVKDVLLLEFDKPREFEDFINFTNEQLIKIKLSTYLKYISENVSNPINYKNYITLYIINLFPNVFECTDELKQLSKNILNEFKEINKLILEKNTCNFSIIDNLLIQYNSLLDNQITYNKNKLIDTYCTLYINLENLGNNMLYDDKIEQINESKNEYFKLLLEIVNNEEEAMNLINTKKNVILSTNNIYDKLQNHFFDNIKEQLLKSPPNTSCIIDILVEIKDILLNFTIKSSKLIDEINNGIDINFIKQMIENNAFTYNEFINIFNFIMNTIRKLHAPVHDSELEEWRNSMELDIRETDNYLILLPDIFSYIYSKLSEIKYEIRNFNNSIN